MVSWLFITGTLFWAFTSNDVDAVRKVGIPGVIAIVFIGIPAMIDYFTKKRKKINFNAKNLRKFEIETTDENEAKSIVTKELFDKLSNLKAVFGAKNISVSFFEKNILVSVRTRKNVFEVGKLSKSVYDIKSYKGFYNELSSLVSLVDYFKNSKGISSFFETE